MPDQESHEKGEPDVPGSKFKHVSDEPKSAPFSTYSEEFLDYKALTYILLGQGIPLQKIHDIIYAVGEMKTLDDLATVNARLMTLAESDLGMPREWLLKQMKKARRKVEAAMEMLPDGSLQQEESYEGEKGHRKHLRELVAGTRFEKPLEDVLKEFNAFSAAVGLYWFCADYHSGQSSDEYRILSSMEYRPGMGECSPGSGGADPEDDDAAVYQIFVDELEPGQSDVKGVISMPWTTKKEAAGLGGPAMIFDLPNKSNPNKGGPTDGSGVPASKPPMADKPMGEKPPMPEGLKPPMADKPEEKSELNQIKSCLDKGELKEALDLLKKLVGEDKPKPKAPFLGEKKEEPKKDDKPVVKEEPKAEPKLDEKPAEKKSVGQCGNCGALLEV